MLQLHAQLPVTYMSASTDICVRANRDLGVPGNFCKDRNADV